MDQENECGDDVSAIGTGGGDGDDGCGRGLSFETGAHVASSRELLFRTFAANSSGKTSSSGSLVFVDMHGCRRCMPVYICRLVRTRQPPTREEWMSGDRVIHLFEFIIRDA